MDSSLASVLVPVPSGKLPLPGPGLLTMRPAFMEVGDRHGITVAVQFRRGRCVWVVVRTEHSGVVDLRIGSKLTTSTNGQCGGQLAEIRAAINSLQSAVAVPVYVESVGGLLESAGITVSPLFPPAVALAAIDKAVLEHVESLLTELVIATDASKGNRSRWRGHGWIMDFGPCGPPILGLRTTEHGSVLEAELHSIFLALKDARSRYAGTLDGRCAVTLLSDNQTAVNLLTQRNGRLAPAPAACREKVTAIHELTQNSTVAFQWVRGHSDNALNNVADRLAVLARRAKEAGLTNQQRNVLVSGVHESVMGLSRQKGLALAA